MRARDNVFPSRFSPELATLAKGLPTTSEWLYEKKFDGYRILTFIKGRRIRLISRNGLDWSDKFPQVIKELEKLPLKSSILDGELVALNSKGISKFQLLQNALTFSKKADIKYYIFDLPYYEGRGLKQVPLEERRNTLSKIIKTAKSRLVKFSAALKGKPEKLLKQACESGEEGLIAKRKDSPYSEKRTRDWLKIKCLHNEEFVIAGYTDPEGSRQYFGSLLIGYFYQGNLHYVGRVGTGFTDDVLKELYQKMSKLKRNKTSFKPLPDVPEYKKVHWVKPVLVAEIHYAELTEDQILRQPVFKGLREDKTAKEVTLEMPFDKGGDEYEICGVTLTHADKIFFPEIGISKKDLAEYYHNNIDRILPYLINRPTSILRCPDGVDQECFFQKHNETLPKTLGTVEVNEDDGKQIYMVIKNEKDVLSLIQHGALEFHTWGCLADDVDKPDQMIFDLDPDSDLDFYKLIECAKVLYAGLEELGIQSFVKTSGKKGLHVYVPLKRVHTWEEVKNFSLFLGKHMVKIAPDRYTTNVNKAKRHGKVFIDYLRNVRGATCVAAYSSRATKLASISTPLSWEELANLDASNYYNFQNITRRLGQLKHDPWEDYFKLKQTLPRVTINGI